jgi:hypothetical protein
MRRGLKAEREKGRTNLVVVAMIRHYVNGLDDVAVLEGGADAELCGDLLLVFLLGFARPLGSELFDGENGTAVLAGSLDEADGAACARAENATPLAILFGEVGLGCAWEREICLRARRGRRSPVLALPNGYLPGRIGGCGGGRMGGGGGVRHVVVEEAFEIVQGAMLGRRRRRRRRRNRTRAQCRLGGAHRRNRFV